MKNTSLLLSVLVALGATACSGSDRHDATTSPSASVTASAPEAPSATVAAGATAAPSTTASAKAPPKKRIAKRRVPKNIQALTAEIAKRCPVAKTENTPDEKLAVSDSVECARNKMHADLDAVLLPLKASDPGKFKALMKEQAEWNRAMERACDLEEERMWVDFDTGIRESGSYSSLTMLGCHGLAVTERTLYARALAAGQIKPLVKRIDEVQKDGAEVKDIALDIQQKAMAFSVTPPADTGPSTADWKQIVDEAGYLIGAAKALATSTCEAWPELRRALGGKQECQSKTELYYYMQGNRPKVGEDG